MGNQIAVALVVDRKTKSLLLTHRFEKLCLFGLMARLGVVGNRTTENDLAGAHIFVDVVHTFTPNDLCLMLRNSGLGVTLEGEIATWVTTNYELLHTRFFLCSVHEGQLWGGHCYRWVTKETVAGLDLPESVFRMVLDALSLLEDPITGPNELEEAARSEMRIFTSKQVYLAKEGKEGRQTWPRLDSSNPTKFMEPL